MRAFALEQYHDLRCVLDEAGVLSCRSSHFERLCMEYTQDKLRRTSHPPPPVDGPPLILTNFNAVDMPVYGRFKPDGVALLHRTAYFADGCLSHGHW